MRYQGNSSESSVFAGHLINQPNDTSSLLTSLSLAVNPRMRLNYQFSRHSFQGQAADREQLITSYRLSPRTSLQTISGFPNIGDTNLLRIRLDHKLGNDLSLLMDYGRLASYQSADNVQGKRGLMVMLRKTWPCWVPARGGRIEGIVSDQLGQPLDGVVVRLGKYSAVSDRQGHYLFRCVPPGTYPMTIAQESVPADYQMTSAKKELTVNDDTKARINFSLVPLGSISGRVYVDSNGNGAYDPGEGAQGIAILANDRTTSSNKDGYFGFYNLDPGTYTIGIALEALDESYRTPELSRTQVELRPGESIADIEFCLEKRQKPVIYTEVLYSQR